MHTSRGLFCLDRKLRVRCCDNHAGQQHLSTKHGRESGSTLVLVTAFMVGLFGFAALTIDVGRVYKEKRHEQFATDAAAYAGAALLPSGTDDDVRNEAINLAAANGVTTNEIQNAGTIELGHWDTNALTFTAGGVTPYDAVRVPAKRTVDMTFGKVVGMSSMNPATHSVAALGTAGRVASPFPIGVSTNQAAGQGVGYFMVLNSSDVSSGKWGALNLGGWQNGNEWQANATIDGCGCEVPVGPYPVFTGITSKITDAITALGLGAIITIPVVDNINTSGNKPANVEAFVTVQLTSFSGSGNNWTATVKFLAASNGDQLGGDCPPGTACTMARAIVQ